MLAWQRYDAPGYVRRIDRGNGTVMTNAVTNPGRLDFLAETLGGSGNSVNWFMNGYTPAGEQLGITRDNDLYAWTGHATGTRSPASTSSTGIRRSATTRGAT